MPERPEPVGNTTRDREPFRVRLPGFMGDAEIGLGDATGRVTGALGFRSCGGCVRRAEMLNRWLVVSPWRGR
jgi:hypothetical protein